MLGMWFHAIQLSTTFIPSRKFVEADSSMTKKSIYVEELKIQIEWRQPDVGTINSPLNLSQVFVFILSKSVILSADSVSSGMLSRHQISDEYHQ